MSRDEELAELVVSAALRWLASLSSKTAGYELDRRTALAHAARQLAEHRS